MDEEPRFLLEGELGRGGMATVWLAYDRERAQKVALKVLHRHLADRPSARRRLERELLAASRVAHPAILHPLEQVEWEGVPALVLPALSGETLADRVASRGPLPESELMILLRSVGGALAAAHAAGVLHRDLTPRNVLWDDEPKLVDFGLARLADQGTASTSALGTVGYAPPETYAEGAKDPRSDAYALGAVLYFAAAGKPPFEAPTAMGALQLQLDGRHPKLASVRPDLSPELCAVVDSLLAPEPEHRPSVPEALMLACRARPETAAGPARWNRANAGAALSLLLTVLVGWNQDLGAFGLAAVIQGHGIPQFDIHAMMQGITLVILTPLSLVPALAGAWLGREQGSRQPPRLALALLVALNVLYALFVPFSGFNSPMDVFGTMLIHLGLYVPLAAALILWARPWLDLSVQAQAEPPPAPVPLAEEARRALASLEKRLSGAPDAVRQDLRSVIRDLDLAIGELEAELHTVETARAAVSADPGALAELETRRARAAARGDPTADHDRAIEAQRQLLAEADALEARQVRATARLLEIRAEAIRSSKLLEEPTSAEPVTTSLQTLRERARLAARARAEVG